MNINGILLIFLGVAVLLLILPARSLGAILKIFAIMGLILVGIFLISQGINYL